MKKRTIFLLIFVTLFIAVGCTAAPEKKDAPAGTAETKTETTGEETKEPANAKMPELLPSESELGIERPMRFAEDVAIVDASDALKEKQYEVPYRLDEKHVMLVSKPLAKGLLSATVYELGDNPATAWEQLTVIAVGYYDLEKKELVKIAEVGKPGYPTTDDVKRVNLFPLDEAHILCEKALGDTLAYSIYTIEDRYLQDFVSFDVDRDHPYAETPAILPDAWTLVEPTADGKSKTHIYDRHTMKERSVFEGGENVRPWKDGVVYLEKSYADDGGGVKISLHLDTETGTKTISWDSATGTSLAMFGIGSRPDGVYALITDAGKTTDDTATNDETVPTFYLQRLFDQEIWMEVESRALEMDIAGPWIALSRPAWEGGGKQKPVYLLEVGEKKAYRITPAKNVAAVELLAYDPYAVVYDEANENDKTVTVTTYELRTVAQ